MTRQEVPYSLLVDVKNYLDITWSDAATDTKIRGLIASASVYLDGKLGESDYEKDGTPRTLLMDYVRYARDSALDVFENNFQALILGAQMEGIVEDGVEKSDAAPN